MLGNSAYHGWEKVLTLAREKQLTVYKLHGSIGLEPMGGSDAEARELLEKISMPNAGELQFTYDGHHRGIRIQPPANSDNEICS